MQDRPDLLQSEMQGLAFDSLETVFRDVDIKQMLDLEPLAIPTSTPVFIVVDPAGSAFLFRFHRRRYCCGSTAGSAPCSAAGVTSGSASCSAAGVAAGVIIS